MNFFEAIKVANEIIGIIKLLIEAIEKLKTSNEELVTKNNEVLAALQTQNEFQLMASNTRKDDNHAA